VGFRSSKAFCKWDAYYGQQPEAIILHDQRTIICRSVQKAIKKDAIEQVDIQGMVNPQYSGTFGTFSVEILQGVQPIILTKVPSQINPKSYPYSRTSSCRLVR
jgi:hypothetical protein